MLSDLKAINFLVNSIVAEIIKFCVALESEGKFKNNFEVLWKEVKNVGYSNAILYRGSSLLIYANRVSTTGKL